MAEAMQGELFEFDKRPVIKGFPELRWTGKHPYTSTQYYPAQRKESYGEPVDGWMNKLFWGDNLQVMSHLLKEFRGKVDLIYIDPPFDSKADYKKTIKLRGNNIEGDSSSFEEKQYGDIWSSDEYLQFMYERLILLRELLADNGSIFLHCDWHKNHQLRMIMDEVFGTSNFINEIAWCYFGPGSPGMRQYNRKHDTIYWYCKSGTWKFNADNIRVAHNEKTTGNFKAGLKGSGFMASTYELADGKIPEDWWEFAIAGRYPNDGIKRVGYPTEKPYKLLERIILGSTDPGDIVFDAFMGSGVALMVAMQNGRRFLGADINMGAIQTTTKRLLAVADELNGELPDGTTYYTGFEVYNVNNYDFFRNPVEAKELIIQALDIQKLDEGNVYDGELDGRMVKILPTNRIATKADLGDFVSHLPIRTFEERKAENPNKPVEKITLVCMGHEPDLKASLEGELAEFKLDVEICDILRDKQDLQFKHEAEADVEVVDGELVINSFYPLNLMQKLSMERETVSDWCELVDSVLIDWNYDGAVLEPAVQDIPEKNELVSGRYAVPEDAGTIKVKITDLLSESLEVLVEA
ncbi:site-specific DNA-methyltransferase [Adlercreutzia sp. ZJ304]|uniref:DNA methyltransferase n=1 Tax=Adlercreutzia sp. ZJ304 TaxID=2709791 RepID=UPI00197EE332|nr:site-specific DNA-methyltransferase [Adlercreutzia sp. ZJ304]